MNPNANQSQSFPLAARASSDPTPREKSVLRLLVQGKTNKQIGNALKLHELSARDIVCRLLRKFGFGSRAQFLHSELPPQWLESQAAAHLALEQQARARNSSRQAAQNPPQVNNDNDVIVKATNCDKNVHQWPR